MAILTYLFEAVLISLSGVLAPGPITSVTIGYGSKNPRAGAWVAVGHGLVEFPVIAGVSLGVGAVVEIPWVNIAISLIGGAFLVYMGVGMLRSIQTEAVEGELHSGSPLLAGVLLSIGSPYFLIWWATVGAGLILRGMEFGPLAVGAFAAGHWLCDLGWDSFLAGLSFRGGQFFGKRFQQVVFALTGGFLLYYAIRLIIQGFSAIYGL
jgi:threonine/homoserine/homoserine lactone efflux protein